MKKDDRKTIFAWAMYDWANSAFAIVVLAGLFPVFYRDYWASSLASEDITLSLATANSLSSVVLILSAVLLGAVADVSGRQRFFLTFCMAMGIGGTLALGLVAVGSWEIALAVYIVATLSFMLGNVFYDALLVSISSSDQWSRVSALGYALGYLGGGLLFVGISVFVINAEQFGFTSEAMVRAGFYATGIWWLVFGLPLIFQLPRGNRHFRWREGWSRFQNTFRRLRAYPNVMWFLLAYWLYIDGVDTIIRMATDYGRVLGFSPKDLLISLLVVQFVGFPATLFYGFFANKFGIKNSLFVAIGVYILICILGAMIETLSGFYAVSVLIGLVQGGIQAQSRAFFSCLIPSAEASQFFGMYNLLGKFAVIVGPLLLGWVGVVSGSPRLGILSISVLLILGALVLLRVSEPNIDNKEMAK